VLLDALHRLKLDAFVRMLHPKPIVVLDPFMGLPDEVDRFSAELGDHTVNSIFVRVMAKYLHLHIDIVFLVPVKPRCRILCQFLSADLL